MGLCEDRYVGSGGWMTGWYRCMLSVCEQIGRWLWSYMKMDVCFA